jgi:beta-lactam-binding protein with PASTA domain
VAATVILSVLLLASCNDAPKTRVPPVDTTSLGEALTLLNRAGLRAQIDSFNRLPGGTGLEGAAVADQDPEPGTKVERGSVVRLTMGVSPIPSPGIPAAHPRFVTVPQLVGLSWPEAEKQLTGLWPQIVGIAPLPADKSADGLSAFVVTRQSLRPGKRVPFMGKQIPNGVDMKPSTIELELGVS